MLLKCIIFYLSRAEKERSQYFSEVNDLRAGLDHISNEKVQLREHMYIQQSQRQLLLRLNAKLQEKHKTLFNLNLIIILPITYNVINNNQ